MDTFKELRSFNQLIVNKLQILVKSWIASLLTGEWFSSVAARATSPSGTSIKSSLLQRCWLTKARWRHFGPLTTATSFAPAATIAKSSSGRPSRKEFENMSNVFWWSSIRGHLLPFHLDFEVTCNFKIKMSKLDFNVGIKHSNWLKQVVS